MKFSDIEVSQWEELQPYLDTCLIPVAGLTGKELPFEVTDRLEKLRDLLDWVEIPFKGRVVTYPSVQYGKDDMLDFVNEICGNVKQSGFLYTIVVSAEMEWTVDLLPNADMILTPQCLHGLAAGQAGEVIKEEILQLWQSRVK
ncbi:DUF2487 family protein [Paenibacillus puldeungensis]|uniref:DUF2487 family protein n=1 Tax=Paenibacillus puldeungensis TaxID=696536 RepID=A0ABW3S1S8_9BACL